MPRATPYLAAAAVGAATYLGIRDELEPPEPLEGYGYDPSKAQLLPQRLPTLERRDLAARYRPYALGRDPGGLDFKQLRTNTVLRWEYRPGSTLFFVWTQQREGSDAYGDFRLGRDRAALFRDRATNIFQVKATYWIGR